MPLFTTLHLHNIADGKESEYAEWFEETLRGDIGRLRGFKGVDRFEVTTEQIMADIPQPWRFLTVYDFDLSSPEIDLPALAPLIASARDRGLIRDDDTERLHTFELYDDWKWSGNYQPEHALSGISIILGNYVAGRFAEYQKWYDEVHSVEVSAVPGHVGMKRGGLSTIQLEPRRYCPGDQLVMCAQQTDDLNFTIGDFSARARGVSPSGIAMEPRSQSGSFARTVHYFRNIGAQIPWPGGIAYDGDWTPYREAETTQNQ